MSTTTTHEHDAEIAPGMTRTWVRDHAQAWAANHYGSDVLAAAFGSDFSWEAVANPSLVNMSYRHYASAWEHTSSAFEIWDTLGRPRSA